MIVLFIWLVVSVIAALVICPKLAAASAREDANPIHQVAELEAYEQLYAEFYGINEAPETDDPRAWAIYR